MAAKTLNVQRHLTRPHTQCNRSPYIRIYTAHHLSLTQLLKQLKKFPFVCCILPDVSCEVKWTRWNQHKLVQCTAGSPASYPRRCLSCHPPYRSIYCNVKYHRTLEDIVWQFCQGSLEYFFLIAQAAASRKWLPCEFKQPLFSWWWKITWFKMQRDKWTGSSFTHGLCGFTVHILKGLHKGECEDCMNERYHLEINGTHGGIHKWSDVKNVNIFRNMFCILEHKCSTHLQYIFWFEWTDPLK